MQLAFRLLQMKHCCNKDRQIMEKKNNNRINCLNPLNLPPLYQFEHLWH